VNASFKLYLANKRHSATVLQSDAYSNPCIHARKTELLASGSMREKAVIDIFMFVLIIKFALCAYEEVKSAFRL